MKNRWRNLLFSVWLWALAPTLLVSSVIPRMGERYLVNIEQVVIGEESQVTFWDLNGDGITERIHGQPGIPLNGFPVMNNDLNFYDQWNLPDKLQAGISDLIFGDFDDDKFGEIYVFTLHGDSVFLNVNEFFDPAGTLLERVFISQINLVEGHPNSTIKSIGFFDNNGDGIKEFYFGITTGFRAVASSVLQL